VPSIVAHDGGRGTPPYPPARRVSISELLGSTLARGDTLIRTTHEMLGGTGHGVCILPSNVARAAPSRSPAEMLTRFPTKRSCSR
jgi:hypothetical protein